MGKYNIDKEWKMESILQLYIANELAEANRLKRIEITKYCNVNHHGNSKDLEDQA